MHPDVYVFTQLSLSEFVAEHLSLEHENHSKFSPICQNSLCMTIPRPIDHLLQKYYSQYSSYLSLFLFLINIDIDEVRFTLSKVIPSIQAGYFVDSVL